jgi:hypothetical protein
MLKDAIVAIHICLWFVIKLLNMLRREHYAFKLLTDRKVSISGKKRGSL